LHHATAGSWLNKIECPLCNITQNQFRRGVFDHLDQLIMTVAECIDGRNQNLIPFIWTAKATSILKVVYRVRVTLII